MSTSTTYKVQMLYELKGNAGAELKKLDRGAKQATGSFGGLRTMMGLALGGGILSLGKKSFYDFNMEVDKLKISLGTIISMNFGVPFDKGRVAADRLFNTFQKMAIESPATTKDYVEMASMIGSAVLQAGKGMKSLEGITSGAITASAALGARPDMLALDITQMLAGTLTLRDRYAKQLLSSIGVTDIKKFNAMKASDRASLVEKSLNTSQLKDAAKAYGESPAGVMSTFKDNMEITLGKIGLPLLKALTKEVKSWTKWISDNPRKVAEISKKMADGMVTGFRMVRKFVGFIVDNRDVLIRIAKAWAAIKIGQGLAGLVQAGVGGLTGLGGQNVNNAGGKQGMGVGALPYAAAAAVAGWSLGRYLGEEHGWDKAASDFYSTMGTATGLLGDETAARMDKNDKIIASMERLDAAVNKAADDFQKLAGTTMGTDQAAGIFGALADKRAARDARKEGIEGPMGVRTMGLTGMIGGNTGAGLAHWTGAAKGINAFGNKEDAGIAATEGRAAAVLVTNVQLMGAMAGLTQQQRESVDMSKASAQAVKENINSLSTYGRLLPDAVLRDILMGASTDTGLWAADAVKPKKTDVNIGTVNVKVASDDPDRFVHGLVGSFADIVRNPVSAADSPRGGF